MSGDAVSLYEATAGAAPAWPRLDDATTASVAIVGAGFTGLSAALHLAEAGVDTIVLEAHEPGWGASGRNGGQVNPGLKHDPDVTLATFGPELGRRMLDLAHGAPAFLFDLAERLGIDCEARNNGTLRAAPTPSLMRTLERSYQQYASIGLAARLLGAEEMRWATGSNRYAGGFLDPSGGDIHPLKFARGLSRSAAKAGVRIFARSPVRSLERKGSQWQLGTDHGRVLADKVLLATNGYSDSLWPGLAQSIVPLYGAVLATAPLTGTLAEEILPGRHSVYEISKLTVYYRVDAHGRLIIGGRGPMRPIHSRSDLDGIISVATTIWPSLKSCQWDYGWNGRLAFTVDQWPHLHAPAPGLMMCLGYSGRGVALSTALGPHLASRLIDEGAELPMPLTSIKPLRLHRFWRVGVEAAIVWEQIKSLVR